MMSTNQQPQERIDILEGILLRLHNGTPPEEVQEEFNEHFTGVSAIEISMMEHQLMNGDSEITFEDVLKLCNVHANLFKHAVMDGDTPDADQAGHPVQVFKDENHAFRAALMRINNLLNVLGDLASEELEAGMLRGLRRQFDLLGQFDVHYERKEKLFFPLMEHYGHDAPPKVMWAKDDEIREQFKAAYQKMEQFPEIDMIEVKNAFAEFEYEFNEMIFKEEAILINILLEALTVDDWYQIAQESDAYGYAIIRPSEEWVPKHLYASDDEASDVSNLVGDKAASKATTVSSQSQQVVSLPVTTSEAKRLETKRLAIDGGYLTVTFEPDSRPQLTNPNLLNRSTELKVGDGYLNRDQINLVLDYLPIELTVVNANDLVIFSNFNDAWPKRHFYSRDYNTLGRSVETIYQRSLKDQMLQWVEQFKSAKTAADKQTVSYQGPHGMVKLDIIPLFDIKGNYEGYIELAMRLDYFDRVNTRVKRELTPVEAYHSHDVFVSDFQAFENNQTKASAPPLPQSEAVNLDSRKLKFAEGDLTLTWENKNMPPDLNAAIDQECPIHLRNGALTLQQLTRLMNAVPFEITFVDDQDIFQYFNNIVPYKDMIFVRTPAQVKRDLELCHPPYLWPTIKELIQSFRERQRHFEELWYPTANNEYIYILYQATYDLAGNFTGIVETVLDIQPFLSKNK